ncbi:MAG: hypothetical protein K9K66_03620 [Desulfarculaceae bacterium]|nr:hypothetical protein [Desulfarculaceae bacterium]MCF8072978.1 hypothetical protein [Desulfarculaceae bacterium]MCF8100726.1 hypothetical protein [Desulfarculaceae bacterium]MCF8115464.1 hypothetical protein [Desulfarculaceae bacterium]
MKAFLCALALALSVLWALPAAALQVGQNAPAFVVESGEEKTLDSAALQGKAVTLFYEARDAVEKSRKLKKELDVFYKAQPPEIQKKVARVAVVDCSGASWPFKGLWRDGLLDASKKEGLTVYGDWDGKMRTAYGLPEDGTSFLVIDPKGEVLYIAEDASQLGPKDFDKIKDAIMQATMAAK